jgi:predicted nuclease of restriction endonuclease-like (RecB) superfamily
VPQIEPELPSGYAGMLISLKELVSSAQVRAQQAASSAMVQMYWEIGATILERQANQPWGTKILQRLAADLKAAFPHMRGFSRSNLFYMRAFAAAWNLTDTAERARVSGLPWGHIIELLKLKDPEIRNWYAEQARELNWRLEVLEHQITTGLHRRAGAAPNNLGERLAEDGAALARSVAKDPLVFDFLGLTKEVEELAMEEAMTQRMSQTLAEFGRGFAFYGRQFHLDAQGEDFYIDLLLVHVPTNRFVVVELKSGKFRPEHLGQLNFYVAAVNDLVKFPGMAPTVGILVCGSKHEPTVRYALDGSSQPVAVSSYTYDSLPPEERAALPSPEAITAALEQGTVTDSDGQD